MAELITKGAIKSIHIQQQPDLDSENFQPVLQVISIKAVMTTDGSKTSRIRVVLSDGEFYMQAMLSSQLNYLVDDNMIEKHGLIRIDGFSQNIVTGRRLMIVIAASPVESNLVHRIGNAVNIETLSGNTESAAPAAQSNVNPPAPQQSAPATRGGAAMRGGASSRGGPAARGGRGGAAAAGGRKDAPMGPLYPIEGLSPYQNKWTIKARVTQKSEIKHWSNQRGEGKLFSVTLMDETAEIRATGFNDAVDSFYELLQEGKVFYISRARINIAKKQFSNVNNEYEIMFESSTEIEPCDDANVPQVQYKFQRIGDIANIEKDQTIDVLAVVKEVGELGSINSKATNKPFAKRDLTLVDQSQWSVRLTLWGKQAEAFTHEDNPVIAFKGVKVGDFGGRSLSMFSSSTMSLHPDIDQAHSLKGWYDAEGVHANFQTYTNAGVGGMAGAAAGSVRQEEIKTIAQVKEENIGSSDKTDYFTSKATINFVKHESFSYPACPAEGCNKKVVQDGGEWKCEKCDKTYPAPSHRYILSLSIMDHTGHIWVTGFNEVGEQLLGMTANELNDLKDSDNEAALTAVFHSAQAKTLTFSCSARQDTFNDQTRIRYSVRRAIPIDYKNEAMQLAKLIDEFQI